MLCFLREPYSLSQAAVEYATRIGRWPEGRDAPELNNVDLFIWTAVYTEGTPHLTHCHDQATPFHHGQHRGVLVQGIVSGAYYSQAPVGSSPIVFTDPRGTES